MLSDYLTEPLCSYLGIDLILFFPKDGVEYVSESCGKAECGGGFDWAG